MKRKSERSLALLLAVTLLTGLLPIGTGVKSRAAEQITLRNPRFIKTTQEVAPGTSDKKELKNPTTENGVTTWDCIYFGNYWQEDTNGDGNVDKNDAKQPIKWRVLSVEGDDVFLLADQNLDCQKYNDTWTDVTWETCTMRSWLNGYGASSNTNGMDYSDDNFLDNAFSGTEQRAIRTTNVVNDDNLYCGTEGGNDTSDKVYLLSIDEVTNPAYGFSSDYAKYDWRRNAKNTAYAKTQGVWTVSIGEHAGNGHWWLRSPGENSDAASIVSYHGVVYRAGGHVDNGNDAARPALHLNLSSDSGWSYAGTALTDDVAEWDCIYFGNYWQEDTNGDGKADEKDEKTPIKWRVLSVEGDDVFLLADKNLDCQKYNDSDTEVTWETCTMRSWLNGYGVEANKNGTDYSSNNFLSNAFSGAEQRAIRTTNVVNNDNPEHGTEGGNDTMDKVYLLSIDEVRNPAYGFSSDDYKYDLGRRAKNTTYAKAQGAGTDSIEEYAGNGFWWLRSPGDLSNYASFVYDCGLVSRYGDYVHYNYKAARPALHLNLSSALGCSYAGTVSSDGTVTAPAAPRPTPTAAPTNQPGSTGETATATPRPTPTATQNPTATPRPIATPTPTIAPTNRPATSRPTPTTTPTNRPGSTGETVTARPNTSVSPGASPGTNQAKAEKKIPQSIHAKSLTKTYGSKPFILSAAAEGDGELTYKSSSPKVATISPEGLVSVKGYGKTVIMIYAEAVDEYMQAEKKITLTVIPRTVNLKKAGSSARKQIQAVWTGDRSVTGYQVYISKKRDFSSETFQRSYGKSKKKFTLFGLRSKQTYYVKIRAYRKVGKTKYYGNWSKVKAVKVK